MKTRVNSILLIEQVHKILAKKFYLPLLLITQFRPYLKQLMAEKYCPFLLTIEIELKIQE